MYERTPWLVRVWSTPTMETRVVMDGSADDFSVDGGKNVPTERAPADALPLRSDDTLAVFTHKLQLLLGKRVYWWATDASGTARCPYMVDGGTGRESLSSTLRLSDTLLDLYETHMATNVVDVMPLDAVLQLNPMLMEPLGVDPAATVDSAAVADAEDVLTKGGTVETYTGKVTTYVVRAGCTRAAINGDMKTFAKALLSPPYTMFGIHTRYDTSNVRVSEDAIRSGDLRIDDAQGMAGNLVRASVQESALLLVATSLDGCTCETVVEGGNMHTAVKTEMPDLLASQEAAVAAQEAVHRLRKTQNTGSWTVSMLHMTATFDTVMLRKGELMQALQRMAPVLYSEPQDNGSVIVHLRRVPRFVATSGQLQFLEMYAYMLDEGQFDELSRMLAREFGMGVEDARAQVVEHAQMRQVVEDQAPSRGMRALTAVGAMAVLKVGNRGLRVSMRSEGDDAFAHRLMWLIGRVGASRAVEHTPRDAPPQAVVSVQDALLRVQQLGKEEEAPVQDGRDAPNMYVIDRLNAHDPRLFRYDGAEGTTYARQCGAVDQRQPIALSGSAMRKLEETMPLVDIPHTIRLGEGGTHYMCPELWCRKAQRPMTRAEADENGGKCPDGVEEPMDMGVSTYWKDTVKRFPGLLAAEKHPLGLHAPCCFKNLKRMMVERLQECEESGQCAPGTMDPLQEHLRPVDTVYKMTGSVVPLPRGREGTLPPSLPEWAFGDAGRMGVNQDFDPVSNAVCQTLRMQRHELVERVTAMGVLQVACIAHGNLLRRFIDQTMHVHDPHVAAMYRAFTRSASGRTYAKQVGKPDALRDFALWNGYHNAMEFMKKGRARNHLFVLPLLMAALRVGIVLLESSTAGVSMHCPFGGTATNGPTRVVVLKQGGVYEPLTNVSEKTLARLGALAVRMCDASPEMDESRNDALLVALREREGLDVESQVVSMSFETVGVMASGLFVPYLAPSPCDLDLPMVFSSALPTSATGRWTPKKVDALFKRLERDGWYKGHEILEHGDSATARVGNHFVPIRNSDVMVKLARTNVMLFANAPAESDGRRPYVEQRLALARTHDLMTIHLISKHPDALYAATHPLCPLTRAQRLDMLMELTSSVSGIEDGVHALASSRLISGQHMHTTFHKHHRNEIVADDQDTVDGTLLYMLESLRDGYGNIATVRATMQGGVPDATAVILTRTGTCPKAWKSTVSGLDLLRGATTGSEGLAEVVKELGGPKLDSTSFAKIVSKEYMKAFDTGKGRDDPVLLKMRQSDVPEQTARRMAEGVPPTAATSSAVLAMCDVNVLAVDGGGRVAGHHASGTDRYVTCFEQTGGGMAFVSLAGSRVLTKNQLPAALASRFKHVGPTLEAA